MNKLFTPPPLRIIFILFLGLILSCKKEIKTLAPLAVTTNATDNTVSFAMAATAAKQITNDPHVSSIIAKQVNSLKSGRYAVQSLSLGNIPGISGSKQIADSVAVPNAENPSYYIFNYIGGGFAILAADKRVMPVLAFSNTGHFKYPAKLHTGLNDWLTVNLKNMQTLRKDTTVKASYNVTRHWAQITQQNTSQTTASNSTRTYVAAPPPPPCVDGDSLTIFGPLLQTQWVQSWPFNQYCPASSISAAGDGYDPAGCVATAMGQIMHYWQYPSSYGSHTYDWTNMPTNTSSGTTGGQQSAAQLMVDIGFTVGMSYSPYESGASTTAIVPSLTGYFGYSSAISTGYGFYTSYMTLEGNINSGMPVLMGGSDPTYGGHEWVCDGYMIDSYVNCEAGTATNYLLLDMNWGLTDVDVESGWYAYDNWTIYEHGTPIYVNSGLTMVYNIHP